MGKDHSCIITVTVEHADGGRSKSLVEITIAG